MSKKLVMGNAAIAYGAIRAGVNLVAGYPGTPSSEILETVAKENKYNIYVEWSVNEKAALEVAAGASMSGARVMVTMKQVGLNVASDPLMCLNYVGIKGGMVVVVADDPGPISSQTEQDTRHYSQFAKMMCFDPSSPLEAYQMIQDAFEYSEKCGKPVIFRPTTRVCHGYQTIDLLEDRLENTPEGFVKDSSKWVIFPRLAYQNHLLLEKMLLEVSEEFSHYRFNEITGSGKFGIATGGVSYEYIKEIIGDRDDIRILKIATPNPFPSALALEFLSGLETVLVVEELDPVIENELINLCGVNHLDTIIRGKRTGDITPAGENTVAALSKIIQEFLNENTNESTNRVLNEALPELPQRPPVLCAGCPHRASFYAVKKAMEGKKSIFCGDIGCYTLGNAKPLDMVDTCLCMGADITMAQGFAHMEPDTRCFSFIGDSTFFASGITGVVNAVYNEADITIMILDNSTTAMTGHQPHPGTGVTMMGNIVDKISIEKVLTAIGVNNVITLDPLKLEEAITTITEISSRKGVKAIIFKSPCIAVTKPDKALSIDSKCINCKKCIRELGCPAIVLKEGKPFIEASLCFGCHLCEYVCPVSAIGNHNPEVTV